MTIFLELAAFAVTASVFIFGAFNLFKKEIPKYFKLYVCAAGCYMLEELWVIVNALLGNGKADGLSTVRLVGIFGCLCFMLSANVNEFDKVVDDGKNKKAKLLSLIAPAILIALCAVSVFSPLNSMTAVEKVMGTLSILPALFGSYYSLKHLLLPEDSMGFLRATRKIDVLALAFYLLTYLYSLANLFFSNLIMSLYDFLITIVFLGIIVFCKKGANKWKALI